MLVSLECVQFSALASVSLKATWWVRLGSDCETLEISCTEEQRSVESRENKVKIDTSGRRKDPQLSSFNPPPSPLCLCSSRPLLFSSLLSSSLCDWSELFWPGFWSQHITSHFVSHNSHLRELAARLCMQPVHRPAAEGIWKQHRLFTAKETQNNGTIWFSGRERSENWELRHER